MPVLAGQTSLAPLNLRRVGGENPLNSVKAPMQTFADSLEFAIENLLPADLVCKSTGII